MRAVVGLRRWRHNPLRRTTDLAEAWVALVALLLICVAAPVTGLVAGTLTHTSLQQTARWQQQHRHPVTARVLDPGDDTAPRAARDAEATAEHRLRRPVPARWTGPDGTPRTGVLTTARQDTAPGDTFRVWTDDRGRPVDPPLTEANARDHAVLAGIGTALLAAGLVEGVRRIVVWRMVQLRYARLDRAWARAGQDWGRAGAGS
ncbi:Rv1733c family protein [Streptomyces lavendulocolor]|uniref:Rv1733c family protein n=1 Tax=Streptomyces lavendulocolor TaxID=67316 RepID=UPI003C2E52D3